MRRRDGQDQLVEIVDEIVDPAIGDADFVGQIARPQAPEAFRRNRPLGCLNQRFPQFCTSFQCFGHDLPIYLPLTKSVSVAQK
jgi:hypothetical protein